MSVFFRSRPPAPDPARAVGVPHLPEAWPTTRIGVGQSFADAFVDSPESAMQAIAVRTAVDLLASLVSEMPVEVFRGQGRARSAAPTPSWLDDPGGDGQGRQDWIYQLMVSWLLRGNLFGEVVEWGRSTGQPTQIVILYPDAVSATFDAAGNAIWTTVGRQIPDDVMFHRRVNPVPGRVLGLSPVSVHAMKLGLDLAATRFGAQWFTDGAHPTGLLTNDGDLTEEQAGIAKARFMAATRGRREPTVLGKGWAWQQLQVSAEESQFLATQGATSAECARMFGPGVAEILGYTAAGGKGGNLTYANVESRARHLLIFTVNRWVRRVERVLNVMTPKPQWVRLNRDAMLEMTTLDRFNVHKIALDAGVETINEVRELEDLPPVPWGNQPFAVAPTATPSPTPNANPVPPDAEGSPDGP